MSELRLTPFFRTRWLTQSILLNCMGMTFSGNRRFLEITMASRSASVTQCRRNGSLKNSLSQPPFDTNTRGWLIESEWKAWIEEEELRRLGFCTWVSFFMSLYTLHFLPNFKIFDCQFPLYFDNTPSLRLNELRQQLPCREAVWDA